MVHEMCLTEVDGKKNGKRSVRQANGLLTLTMLLGLSTGRAGRCGETNDCHGAGRISGFSWLESGG